MVGTVEVDGLVVRGSIVERLPAGDAGHVDIGAEFEVADVAGHEVFLDEAQLLGLGDDPGARLGAGTAAVTAGVVPAVRGNGDDVDAAGLDGLVFGEGKVVMHC